MKTVAIAALVAVIASGTTVLLTASTEPPAYVPGGLEDRLNLLEARLDTPEPELPGPMLQGRAVDDLPDGALEELATRLEVRLLALEQRLEALERGVGAEGSRSGRAKPRPRRRAPGSKGERPAPKSKKTFAERREAVRRLPTASQPKALYELAMAARSARRHDLEEEFLRAAMEAAGEDSAFGAEAGYQIGWARMSSGDYAGAREAWLATRDRLQPEHWRYPYARMYAARSAIFAGEGEIAARELEDLIADLEREASGNPQRVSVLEQSRRLLGPLRKQR